MPGHAITFDFHDTLVHCDEWFQLEVRHFPSAFLTWHNRSVAPIADDRAGIDLDRDYRRLRTSIIQHGHELSAERSIAVIFERAGLYVSQETIETGVEFLMRSALKGATAVNGAVETVHSLAANHIPLGVVSSAVHHPFLEWALARFGMLEAFKVVVTSASSGYYKSRPEIYWGTLETLGAHPAGSLHVGDSARFDVDGAGRAGMQTVWLNRGSSNPPSRTPTLTVDTLEGVAPSLLGIVRGQSS